MPNCDLPTITLTLTGIPFNSAGTEYIDKISDYEQAFTHT